MTDETLKSDNETLKKARYDSVWLTSEVQTIHGPVWPNTAALRWDNLADPMFIYLGSVHHHNSVWDSPDFDVYLESLQRLILVWGDHEGHYWDWPISLASSSVDPNSEYSTERNEMHDAALKLLALRLQWTLDGMNQLIARTLEAYRA